MGSINETEDRISFYHNIEPALKALELYSAMRIKESRDMLRKSSTHHDNVARMVQRIVQQNASVLGRNRDLVAHPELPNTHVIVISPSRGLLCQSLINKELGLLRHLYPDTDTTSFSTVGEEGRKIVNRAGGLSHVHTDAPHTPAQLSHAASKLTDVVYNQYLHNGVGSVCILSLEQTLAPRSLQLLPIRLTPEQGTGPKSALEIDGDADALLSQLFRMHISTTIFQALLETRTAEHLSRMTIAHRGADNIDEMLPELVQLINSEGIERGTKEILELTQYDS
jgi:F-type H+-transporting ATPase subunit gamma